MAKLKNNKKKNTKIINTLFKYMIVIVLSFSLTYLFSTYIAGLAYVPSESMCNTLQIGDNLLVSKSEYKIKDFERGDIILFYSDETEKDQNILVKRIIGLSGDTITIKNGIVSVNGKENKEDYAIKDNYSGEFHVPEDSLFVMGDNRDNSFDSRFWDDPYVKKKDVIGKVAYRVYPNPVKFE